MKNYNVNSSEIKDKESLLFRYGRKFLFPFFKLFYFVKIKYQGNIPEGRCIICSNHSCFKDPILLALSQKRQIYFMAKSEFFKNVFLSKLFKKLGAFPVKRNTGDISAVSYAEDILNHEKILGIFIEGTRSKDGNLLRPKNGAAMIAYKTNSPIVPVSLSQKNGKPMKIFHKITVNIGKALYPAELGIIEGKPREFRSASRVIMDKIRELREEDVMLLQERK